MISFHTVQYNHNQWEPFKYNTGQKTPCTLLTLKQLQIFKKMFLVEAVVEMIHSTLNFKIQSYIVTWSLKKVFSNLHVFYLIVDRWWFENLKARWVKQTKIAQNLIESKSTPVWWKVSHIRSVWKWCQWCWYVSSLPWRNAKYRSLAFMMNFGSFLSPNAFILDCNIRDLFLIPQLFL